VLVKLPQLTDAENGVIARY
jgi:hypothetical protein